jgi:hypothetical protein
VSVRTGDGAGGFGPKTDFATGTGPFSLAIGDVSGDGRLDLATANFNGGNVTLLLSGGARFAAKAEFATGAAPVRMDMADLNGDGYDDIVAANSTAGTVSVLLANGSGGFSPKSDFATGSNPYSVTIADVSGDGYPDVAVANTGSHTVSVLLGTGSGSLGPKTDYPTGTSPRGATFADVNLDGHRDIVVANRDNGTVSVLLGDGTGGFGTKTDFVTGSLPLATAVGLLNADANPDLVVANFSSGSVSVLLGNGTGGFGAKTDFVTGAGTSGLALADLNGDGALDLVAGNALAHTVSVLPGNGAGGFGAKTDLIAGTGPGGAAIADLNLDGRLDLAVANLSSGTVSVFLGDGAGGFGPKTDHSAGSGPGSIAAGDVNGDGRLDLATANFSANAVGVLAGLVPTRTEVTASPSPVVLGTPVTLTASVMTLAPGGSAPGDSVRFFDGTTLLGTAPVNGGVAGLALFAPRLGDRAITAVFKGDGARFGSFSGDASQRVVPTAAAGIMAVTDVANDQGGQVRLLFGRSPLDYAGSGTPITQYKILRREIVLGSLAAGLAFDERAVSPNDVTLLGWDELTSITATGDEAYQAVVPTLADSNSSGLHYTVFMVRAIRSTPTSFYDSSPDSGYSVDNLPPVPPAPFTSAYEAGATHLHWGVNTEPDLWHYRVYRGNDAGFVPGTGNLITATADTGHVDPGPEGSYYKLSAVDVNGNESGYTLLAPNGTVDVEPGIAAFGLQPLRNPSPGGRLHVSFSLGTSAPATLELLDVSGRRVTRRQLGARGPGRYELVLGAGRRLQSGIYFIRLVQGDRIATRRVSVLE